MQIYSFGIEFQICSVSIIGNR